MKHWFFITWLLISLPATLRAQDGPPVAVENARNAFIAQRLQLTGAQEQLFWPMYNEYASQKMALRKSLRRLSHQIQKDSATLTDEQAKTYMNQVQTIRQQELTLENEYKARFLKVLSPKQYAQLWVAERDFVKLLKSKIREE